MRISYKFFAALFLVLGVSSSTLAQTGQYGYFNVFNNTSNNVVISLYTSDGGAWSSNWLSGALYPGEYAQAGFIADSGLCLQYITVGWLGDGNTEVLDDPISIDICQASNVYLDDNQIYFD
jgi:hypothetical protein